MIRMRIQVEEMHVYYFIAKKLINNAKLGFLGIMASAEEKLINKIYSSDNLDEIDELSKKLFDKLDKEQTKLKINTNPYNLKDTEELISEAVFYTSNLLFKPEVLENVKKTLKSDLNIHDKIILCIDKICQTKRVLAGLSPDEKKQVLDGKGFEVKKKTKNKSGVIKAVDEENVGNVTDLEVSDVSDTDNYDVSLDENMSETFYENFDEDSRIKKTFTAEDIPSEPISNIIGGVSINDSSNESLVDDLEEVEVLDVDEEIINSYEEEVELLDVEEDTEEEIVVDTIQEDEEFLDVDDSNSEVIEDSVSNYDEVVNAVDMPPVSIIEPSPLEERIGPQGVGFGEVPMVYPQEEFEEKDNIVEVEKFNEEEIESSTKAIVVEKNKMDYAVPEIVRIIEKDGIEVDEEVTK